MELALIETNILWEDKQGNYEKLAGVLEELNALGRLPLLVALPEMSFTGFTMNTDCSAETDVPFGGYPTVERMKELAAKYDVAIAFGWVKKPSVISDGSGSAENHYTIVSPLRQMMFDYVKIHPFCYSGEDRYFKGGDDVCTCRYGGFNIGAAICYDLRFAETFYAMPDAELIFVPANWPEKRREHFVILCRARAIENQCYIAAINCHGNIGGVDYAGDSMLVSPNGDVVLPKDTLHIGADKILIYDIENNVRNIREGFPVLGDRKPISIRRQI